MGVTADVFIKFKGSKNKLLKILADDFLILAGKKKYWFLNYIELGLCARTEDSDSFVGRQFRPYNFILYGTIYGLNVDSTVGYAHPIIMDTIAQMLTVKLKTRTMFCIKDWEMCLRYRHVRPMKRNKFSMIIDEKTKKPPQCLFQ